ncbi:cysteine-rich CWC family protein [Spirosoma fluminis]
MDFAEATEADVIACPRCQRTFACRAGTIGACQCQAVELTATQRHHISTLYTGCLCADCLVAVRSEHERVER